jgi:PEP-CTERM motif-containing protein
MLSIRRNMSLVLVTVALMMFAAVPLRADVTSVTFHDTGETVTADVSGRASITKLGGVNLCGLISLSAIGQGQGTVEGCLVTVLPPTGFGNDLEGGGGMGLIGESTHGKVSDAIYVFPSRLLPSGFGTIGGVQVLFLSDTQEVSVSCPVLAGCSKVETGGVQEGRDLFWLNGSNDSIHDKVFFQSDLTEVPEPASLVLLGSGLFAVASYLKRRLA